MCTPVKAFIWFKLVNIWYASSFKFLRSYRTMKKTMELMVHCFDFGYASALTTETHAGVAVEEELLVPQIRVRVL